MTMTKTSPNGHARKQLSDQIDRMEATLERQDGIIDALSEGLNLAVETAVENAVGVAVQKAVEGVLRELLMNPAVREMLHPPAQSAPAVPPAPTPSEREGGQSQGGIGAFVRSAAASCANGVAKAYEAGKRLVSCAGVRVWSGLAATVVTAASGSYLIRNRLGAATATVAAWASGLTAKMAGVLGRWPIFAS
jgi:hypothetical protein